MLSRQMRPAIPTLLCTQHCKSVRAGHNMSSCPAMHARNCMLQDAEHYGRPKWSRFGEFRSKLGFYTSCILLEGQSPCETCNTCVYFCWHDVCLGGCCAQQSWSAKMRLVWWVRISSGCTIFNLLFCCALRTATPHVRVLEHYHHVLPCLLTTTSR